jgi:hypothetical protein
VRVRDDSPLRSFDSIARAIREDDGLSTRA